MRKSTTSSEIASPVVLITGGSGYLGSRVLKELASNKSQLVALYRRRLPESHPNIYPVQSDLSSMKLLAAPLRGVDVVIHLAWEETLLGSLEYREEKRSFLENRNNVVFTKNLIQAAEDSGCRRFIFVSALGARDESESEFLREKYKCENYVINSGIKEKILLRPSLIFGGDINSNSFVRYLYRLISYPFFYPCPKKRVNISPVFIDEVCQSIKKFGHTPIQKEITVKEIVGPELTSLSEVIQILANKISNSTKIPVRHFLGDSMLSFIEKHAEPSAPKWKDFMALENVAFDSKFSLNESIVSKHSLKEYLNHL